MSPAQAAYEAYYANVQGAHAWEDVPIVVQARWIAAANAARKEPTP